MRAFLQGAVVGAALTLVLVLPGQASDRRLSAPAEGCEVASPPVRRAGWSTADGRLIGKVHLAHLDAAGQLPVPPGAKVILEVGANSRNTADEEYLPLIDAAFLISFEPLLDKWATLLSRKSRADRISTLGHHHARGIALPFAVSPAPNGQVELKVSGSMDGCASLLKARTGYFSAACTNASGTLDSRVVASVNLDVVVRQWLGGRRVEFAKIDAKGLDVEVLRSAGPALRHIKAVQLEVVRDRQPLPCRVQYEGAQDSKCPATVRALAELGFEPWGTNCTYHTFTAAHGCEADMTFVRPGDFDEELVQGLCTATWPHSCGPGAWSSARRAAAGRDGAPWSSLRVARRNEAAGRVAYKQPVRRSQTPGGER